MPKHKKGGQKALECARWKGRPLNARRTGPQGHSGTPGHSTPTWWRYTPAVNENSPAGLLLLTQALLQEGLSGCETYGEETKSEVCSSLKGSLDSDPFVSSKFCKRVSTFSISLNPKEFTTDFHLLENHFPKN